MEEQEQVLQRIRQYCAFQERCNQDVTAKLRSWHLAPQKIKTILINLTHEGFISESRFAKAFVRGKFKNNQWGRYKIRYELMARSIPENIIGEAMKEIGEEEYLDALRTLILKKIKERGLNTLNLRNKILNFATGKGYEPDLILKTLNNLKI